MPLVPLVPFRFPVDSHTRNAALGEAGLSKAAKVTRNAARQREAGLSKDVSTLDKVDAGIDAGSIPPRQ